MHHRMLHEENKISIGLQRWCG